MFHDIEILNTSKIRRLELSIRDGTQRDARRTNSESRLRGSRCYSKADSGELSLQIQTAEPSKTRHEFFPPGAWLTSLSIRANSSSTLPSQFLNSNLRLWADMYDTENFSRPFAWRGIIRRSSQSTRSDSVSGSFRRMRLNSFRFW